MSVHTPETLVVSRGMALHKMIRFITIALGGEVKIPDNSIFKDITSIFHY